MRAARAKLDGNVFDADERVLRPAMPNWWIFGASNAFVAYSVSLAVWYIAPRLVRSWNMPAAWQPRSTWIVLCS